MIYVLPLHPPLVRRSGELTLLREKGIQMVILFYSHLNMNVEI